MAIFPTFFLGNLGQENVFYDILQRKNASLSYKNKKFKKSKNWYFSKGLTHVFGPKMAIFLIFFRQYRPGKCRLWYSRTKACLSRLQKQEVQKVEKLTFFHGFGPKMAIFPNFCLFRQYRPGKVLLWYSRIKKTPF